MQYSLQVQARATPLGHIRSLVLTVLACLASSSGFAAVPSPIVNPTDNVDPELQLYVYRFQDVLRSRGFTIAKTKESGNLDLNLTLTKATFSVTVTAELLHDGQVLVSAPAKNSAISKESAINPTVAVTVRRFTNALDQYLSANGPVPKAPPRDAATSAGNN